MKKLLLIGVFVLAVVAGSIGFWYTTALAGNKLDSKYRRVWKQKTLEEIAVRVANPDWPANEIARLQAGSASDRGVKESWLSDRMILMRDGEWLAYSAVCRKENRRIYDIFLARGSDGKWYYSTYHFCIDMVSLRGEEQPEDLNGFAREYYLSTFDGVSDECLRKTWPAPAISASETKTD
jgi:hypothetical protein